MSWAGPCPAPPRLVLGWGLPRPSSEPLQHWVGWQSPLVSGTPGGAPGSLDCVHRSGEGAGERGWAGAQGRKLLTRRAKDRVVPYPRSHPCALPPCPPRSWAACCFSCFPFPWPCPALSCMDPTTPPPPGAARKEHEWRITDQRKKDYGGPPPPPSAAHSPTSLSRRTDHPPCPRGVPTPSLPWAEPLLPGPISEIAH